MERVETERLSLRRWRTADVIDAFAEMNRDPDVTRFLKAGRPMGSAESEEQSNRIAAHWDRHGFGLWAVFTRGAKRMIGFAGLQHPAWMPDDAHRVEVGWRLERTAWGKGYATEAGTAALAAGFGTLGLGEVISLIQVGNERSIAVAERLGLAEQRPATHPEQGFPLVIYAMDRDRWLRQNALADRDAAVELGGSRR